MYTWGRFLRVILVSGSLVGSASAQSVFHFPRVEAAGPGTLTVANVGARDAEVDFELFGLDGGASGNALKRVRYRLEAGEVFSMPVDTVFAASGVGGGGSGSAATCRGSPRSSFREMPSLVSRPSPRRAHSPIRSSLCLRATLR